MLSLMLLSGSAVAQMTEQREPSMRPKRVRMTQEQMTEKMVSELKLDEKQASYDYDKQQTKYDNQMRKLLSDEQYEGYLKLRPQSTPSAGFVSS